MTVATPKPMRRRWRPWKVLAGVFVVLLLAFFAWQWYRESVDEARLREAIAATDAVDPSWRMADMVKEYDKLPVSISFPQAASIFRGYRGWFGDDIGERPGAIAYDRTGTDFNVRFPEPYLKIIRERLAEKGVTGPEVMREALEKMALEPALCKVPFEDNNMLQRARSVSNYLLDEMELAGHEGRERDLSRQLRSQLRLSSYCLATPKLINQLVGIAIRAQGLSGIRRSLALGVRTPAFLVEAQQILAAEDRSHAVHIVRTARAENFDNLEQAQRDPVRWKQMKADLMMSVTLPSSPSLSDRFKYVSRWIEVENAMRSIALAQAETLECGKEAIELVQKDPAELLKLDPAALPLYVSWKLKPMEHLAAKQFKSWCFKMISAEAAIQADVRALIVALACERYRLATGEWPKSLDDLKPGYLSAIPLDPNTGKELLYRTMPDGMVVYAVGINGVDDGGHVLDIAGTRKDRGVKLFIPASRGRKFDEVYPDRVRRE